MEKTANFILKFPVLVFIFGVVFAWTIGFLVALPTQNGNLVMIIAVPVLVAYFGLVFWITKKH